MEEFKIPDKNKHTILALGAESAGNFSIFQNGVVYFSEDFGDLADENNFSKFQSEVFKFIKNKKIKLDTVLSDLHPLFRTTQLAETLAKKYGAEHMPVQHHLAHIFSAIGDEIIHDPKTYNLKPKTYLGIACDGTGFGLDERVWGGEIFSLKAKSQKLKAVRIGHLENQILLGGESAINEPARVLISILSKFLAKDEVYNNIKKYYSKNEFELLWNQLEQKFNCLETSSTARILDAVSVLLEFSKNEKLSKHGPIALLEQNSTKPFNNIKPKIERYKIQDTNNKQISNSKIKTSNEMLVLNTTFLFEYLIKNIHKDKSRLAATAQKYIADGLWEICHQSSVVSHQKTEPGSRLLITDGRLPVFFAGGMANNLIMSKTLTSHDVYTNKKIPRGDAGISLGQIFYCLLADSRN